jgi:hypothetical protein
MNLPPLPLKDGALLIDNSFLERFTSCPRSLEYDRLLRRTPALEQPALNFGTAIHAALEYRYRHCKNEPPTPFDEQDIYDKVLEPFFAQTSQPEGDHRTLQFAMDIVKRYNSKYNTEPFRLMTDDKGEVMAELSFMLPLYTQVDYSMAIAIPVFYTGRIDLPVLWDDQIIVGDHKTASQLGELYFNGQRIAPQFEGYCWAFEQLTGKKVDGYFINAIRTKEPAAKPRNGIDAWWDEGFQRHKEYLKPGQLDEWKVNTIAHVKEFFYHYQNDYMPQRKKACTMYGKCPYYDVCYLPSEQRNGELMSDKFRTNEWSPLK